MNTVALMGRLTKDPMVSEYGSGKNAGLLTRFTMAVRRDGNNADFISCVAFGKTAELIDQYFKKGDQIGVTGSIQTGKYKNKDGDTVYTTDVIVRQIDFTGSAGKSDNEDEEYAPTDTELPFPEDDEEEEEERKPKKSGSSGRSRRR